MTPLPLLAFLDLNPEKLVQFVVNVLAVGGGYLVGQFVFGAMIWFADRKLTGGKLPKPMRQAWAMIGGLATAVLVALIVFGHGTGWTFMGGGGPGDQNGTPTTAGTGAGDAPAPTPAPPTTEPAPKVVPPTTKPLPASHERVRVTLLGGEDVRDERFYLLDDDAAPRTFGETRAALTAKKEAAGRPVGLEVRFAERNTLPTSHPAVLLLTNWAQTHGLTVTFPADNP